MTRSEQPVATPPDDTATQVGDRTEELVRVPTQVRRVYDVVAMVALVGTAWWVRRNTMPGDGLWFDDSWVAAGAIHGSPRNLLVVGSGHPGFTGLLMAIHRLGSGSTWQLGLPSLIAGVLGPAALYAALRVTKYERSVATLLAAALVVAPIPALYAGRVKGYTLDTLFVLLLAVAVPFVAQRRWSPQLAIGWTVAMLIACSFSGYVLLASAAATLVIVMHPRGDLALRVGALVTQAVVQLLYLRTAQSKTDLKGIEDVMEEAYDGHMTFYLDPRRMFHEVMRHLRRIAEVYPGGSHGWLSLFAVLALIGLALGAARGQNRTETLTSRFLLLAFSVAAAGSLVDRFPFGPTNDGLAVLSAGGRHTLWLLPAFAFGLAALLSRIRSLTARTNLPRLALDVILVATALTVVVARYQPAPPAPYQGSGSMTRFVDENLGPHDLAVVTGSSTFSFSVSTDRPVHLVETPTHQVGFAPAYDDPRILTSGGWTGHPTTQQGLTRAATDSNRVFVLGDGGLSGGGVKAVGTWLEDDGFELQHRWTFDWATVEEWHRPTAP